MSEKVTNRNRAVLDAALACAAEVGYLHFTRSQVAERAGVSTGSVSNSFESMDCLRDAVVATAVERDIVALVAQALANRHATALGAPPELKQRALESLAA